MAPKTLYRKYPAFARVLKNRHVACNEALKQIRQLEQLGDIFAVGSEKPLDIGRLEKDPGNVQRVCDIGRANAQKCMQKLLGWLRL